MITAAAVVAVLLGRDRLASLVTSLASPETQIREALARQTRAELDGVYGFGGGGTAELAPLRYREIVATSVERGRASVTALLDAEGRVRWRDETARIAYVGRESFHMRPCTAAPWCADGDQFARLRRVLSVLFRREDAFHARDAAAYARLVSPAYRDRGIDRDALLTRLGADFRAGPPARQRILAWQIRVDRETAEVGEDYELSVAGGEPRRLRARYRLAWDGDRWLVTEGL